MANDDEPIDKARAAAYRAMMKRAATETCASPYPLS